MSRNIEPINSVLLPADVDDILEKYDENRLVKEYHYQWKRIIPKEGIMSSHISAWENESHDAPNTPAEYLVKTEPHHHHHIPGQRKRRKESYHTRTLEAVFEFVAQYIRSGKEYKPFNDGKN